MHWVEIEISFIAIYQMVGKWRGGVGVWRSCGEAFRRDIVLSGTSKCRYGSPLETLGETSHKPIQINALLVKGNARQTWCRNRASWEMFEEHLCKEFAGCGNKAVNNNQQPSSVYYHQRCRLGSWMAFFFYLYIKQKPLGVKWKCTSFYNKQQSYLVPRLTLGRFRPPFFSFFSLFAQKYNVLCYKHVKICIELDLICFLWCWN